MGDRDKDRENTRDSSSDTTSPPKKLARIKKETNRMIINLKDSSVLQVNKVVEQIRKDTGIEDEKKIELIRNSIAEKFVPIDKVEKVVQDAIEDKIDVEDEKKDYIEHYTRLHEIALKDYVEHYTRLHESALKDKIQLQEKLDNALWPMKIRNLVRKVESIFMLDKLDVCYQCATVTVWHPNQTRCIYDPTEWLFPTNPEAQRIFIRFRRWIYFIFTDKKEIISDYRVLNLKTYLRQFYDTIKSKAEDALEKSEEYLRKVPDFDEFKKAFCYEIAEACENCDRKVKEEMQIELGSKIETLNEFGVPTDNFIILLINSFSKVKIDGPKVTYKQKSRLNIDADIFVPKFLLKRDE